MHTHVLFLPSICASMKAYVFVPASFDLYNLYSVLTHIHFGIFFKLILRCSMTSSQYVFVFKHNYKYFCFLRFLFSIETISFFEDLLTLLIIISGTINSDYTSVTFKLISCIFYC